MVCRLVVGEMQLSFALKLRGRRAELGPKCGFQRHFCEPRKRHRKVDFQQAAILLCDDGRAKGVRKRVVAGLYCRHNRPSKWTPVAILSDESRLLQHPTSPRLNGLSGCYDRGLARYIARLTHTHISSPLS